MYVIIAVPARLESSRLPNKVLCDIGGKPMIQRVLEQCSLSKLSDNLFLCCDDESLLKKAESWGFQGFLTSKKCSSGSARIASIIEKLVGKKSPEETLIINVQGDQPFIDPKIIDKLIEFSSSKDILPEVVTPIYKIYNEDIHNPNLVKTLISNNKEIIYFSRSALPFIRDEKKENWSRECQYWGHVGIYGYRGDILMRWESFPDSNLEKLEKLEQLRLIDAGIKFHGFEVEGNFISIDTKEQLFHARKIFMDK